MSAPVSGGGAGGGAKGQTMARAKDAERWKMCVCVCVCVCVHVNKKGRASERERERESPHEQGRTKRGSRSRKVYHIQSNEVDARESWARSEGEIVCLSVCARLTGKLKDAMTQPTPKSPVSKFSVKKKLTRKNATPNPEQQQ